MPCPMQKRYAFPNMGAKSYTTVKYGIKTLASLADCIIFLFLGVVTITHNKQWHTGFIIWTLVLCFIVRYTYISKGRDTKWGRFCQAKAKARQGQKQVG